MIDGIINIYKEAGMTSHDVVNWIRRMTGIKKVGHTGTLDPDAEGVLAVCLGKATKAVSLLADTDKAYDAVVLLGVSTDTFDASGRVTATADENDVAALSADEISAAVSSFNGGYDQIPPLYSAKKVNGRKLYELARAGETADIAPCFVKIYDIKINKTRLPRIYLSVSCGSGTYIRSLCNDIGKKLGTGACMESLVRTRACGFDVKDSIRLDEAGELFAAGRLDEKITPVDELFCRLPRCIVKKSAYRLVINGNKFLNSDIDYGAGGGRQFPAGERIRVYSHDGGFIGIYEKKNDEYVPVKIFFA